MEKLIKEIEKKLSDVPEIVGKERKYKNASILIPLVQVNNEVHILYQVRSEYIRHGGEIGFPGGMMEPEDNGSYKRGAVRETVEELGIDESQIQVIGHFGTYVTYFDVTVDVYIGLLKIENMDGFNLSDEVDAIFTVPLKKLKIIKPECHYIQMKVQQTFIDEEGDEVIMLDVKALGLPKKYEASWRTIKRKVYFYRWEEHIIWGMTGEITHEFLRLMD